MKWVKITNKIWDNESESKRRGLTKEMRLWIRKNMDTKFIPDYNYVKMSFIKDKWDDKTQNLWKHENK